MGSALMAKPKRMSCMKGTPTIIPKEVIRSTREERDFAIASRDAFRARNADRSSAALEALKHPSDVQLWTDSQYVQQGITAWIHSWKRNGWKTADKKPVKNAELWQRLDALRKLHQVEWRWVKGHAGHVENERADALANKGVESVMSTR